MLTALLALGLLLAPPAGKPTTVVFLGDSLTAGLGLSADQAYPALVAKALLAEGREIRAVNAGVSGDTSAGGLRRLGWLLSQKPAVVVLALGANDGLRGLPVKELEENLRRIVTRARAEGATVLLCGMLVPTNYGPDYGRDFAAVFPRLARELSVAFVPFLLSDVAGRKDLNQTDGVHPNPAGQEIVAKTVLQALRPLLSKAP